jgi:hypothetical protein
MDLVAFQTIEQVTEARHISCNSVETKAKMSRFLVNLTAYVCQGEEVGVWFLEPGTIIVVWRTKPSATLTAPKGENATITKSILVDSVTELGRKTKKGRKLLVAVGTIVRH